MKNIFFAGLLLMVGLGCATTTKTEVSHATGMTVKDVIALSQSGASDQEIIRQIDKTRSVFQLTGADLSALRAANVSSPVVTHMLDTYTRTLLRESAEQPPVDYSYGYGYPFTGMFEEVDKRW
jgi:hypothetical protein